MLLDTGKKQYETIREVFTGKVNDVYVCRNPKNPPEPYKTVWMVRQHEVARRLLRELEANKAKSSAAYDCYECFTYNETVCFAFPYIEERPLRKFYQGMVWYGGCSREKIWESLVTQCMVKGIPAGILRLILTQQQVQIDPDGNVDFSFFLDLAQYDDKKASEQDNIVLCANLIMELAGMEGHKKEDVARRLLERKIDRKKYHEFLQLLQDVRIIRKEQHAKTGKVREIFTKYGEDRLCKALFGVCAVLACITVFVLAGYLIFGESIIWKLSGGALDQIGTESLLQ